MDAYVDDPANAPLVAEKAPLPLAVVPPLKHVKTIPALHAIYTLQILALMSHLNLDEAKDLAPCILVGMTVGTAIGQWTLRRQRRKRERQAVEEGWTVGERAEKEREAVLKANQERRKCVWVLGVSNVVMMGLLGAMVYYTKIKN